MFCGKVFQFFCVSFQPCIKLYFFTYVLHLRKTRNASPLLDSHFSVIFLRLENCKSVFLLLTISQFGGLRQ